MAYTAVGSAYTAMRSTAGSASKVIVRSGKTTAGSSTAIPSVRSVIVLSVAAAIGPAVASLGNTVRGVAVAASVAAIVLLPVAAPVGPAVASAGNTVRGVAVAAPTL